MHFGHLGGKTRAEVTHDTLQDTKIPDHIEWHLEERLNNKDSTVNSGRSSFDISMNTSEDDFNIKRFLKSSCKRERHS